MNSVTYKATIINGQIRFLENVQLPENSKVLVIVADERRAMAACLRSPRLAHPEQAAEFNMEVQEITDAGI